MKTVFNDITLQHKFENDGYVIIPSFLNGNDLKSLLALFEKYQAEYTQPFHTSHFSENKTYKKNVSSILCAIVGKSAAAFTTAYKPVFGNFMIKLPNLRGFLQLHADWTYVDESTERSFAVWIPLVDINEKNGCLGVIETSHKIMNEIRGPGIQQNNFTNDLEWVKDFGKLLPVNAGDAIIYDHALLHFSNANTTTKIRPALNVSFVPDNTQMIHYCIPEGRYEIEKYNVPDTEFFINYSNYQQPENGILVEKIPKDRIIFIDDKMKVFGRKKNLFYKLKKIFNL